jgi:preprotein translocase subunit SecE
MSTEETLDKHDNVDDGDQGDSTEPAGEQALASDEGGAGKKTLGLERWVQLTFVAIALLLVWLLDHVISGVWYFFADPDESVVTLASVLIGVFTAAALYRHRPSYTLTHEVVDELSKVTWPTRKETSSSTVTVVIVSLIAAFVLFMFDTVWSSVTDLVYKV